MVLTYKIWWRFRDRKGITKGAFSTDAIGTPEELFDQYSFWIFEGSFASDYNRSKFLVDIGDREVLDTHEELIFDRIEFYLDGKLIGVDGEADSLEYVLIEYGDLEVKTFPKTD